MGGSLLATSSNTSASSSSAASGLSSAPSSSKAKKNPHSSTGNGTVRLFFSLKENPNAIISYTDLIRQEQGRQRTAQSTSAKNGGNATLPSTIEPASSTPGASASTSSSQTAPAPPKNQKGTGTGVAGKEGGAAGPSSTTAMDIDPPEGEEALGEGDSEAEDDDEEDDEEDDNEDGTEAEDEDDDDDPDEEAVDDDDPESRRRGPKDFLEALTEKYAGMEEGNDGEDEDEDEDDDDKGKVQKRPSRWDTEHYDIEDEFIDDSEMMLESIGMVRPKVEGFFAYRGPVETTNEDPDSSDAGPRSKRLTKRKPAAGSSPLGANKTGLSKSNKGSSLAVMDNANDSTSEMSEMDDKPKPTKLTSASSGLANSSVPNDAPAASGGDDIGSNNTTTTPTKKKTALAKSKAAGKDISKDGTDTGKDSDRETKGSAKRSKAKPTKAAGSSSTATAPAVATPLVRVDSPPPPDDQGDNATSLSPPSPSRSVSPSRSKSKVKPQVAMEADQVGLSTSSESIEARQEHTAGLSGAAIPSTEATGASTQPATSTGDIAARSKTSKTLEPLNEEIQAAYDIVADLARKETWEVKTRFPPHIKTPLFDCARIALAMRSSGYVLEDSFFVHLQAVLPYNKFTLKKLINKNVLPGWIADLEVQKTRLIEQFSTRAQMVWKASGLANQDKGKLEKDGDGDVNMTGEDGKSQRKFPWSQDLRLLLWETMEKIMEIHAAKHELRLIDDSQPTAPTESKTRKDAYQTLLAAFPQGWMTSYEISRQYSQLKEKVQKQEKRGDTEQSSSAAPAWKPRPVFSTGGPKSANPVGETRASSVQASGSTTGDKKATSAAPAPGVKAATTPSSSTASGPSSTTAAAPTQSPIVDTPREVVQRPSPSMSPSSANRTAHLSEIVHPPAQSIPQQSQHTSYVGGSMTNRKRKIAEEGRGTGASHDPMVIADSHPYDEPMISQGYRQSGGNGGSEYPSSSSSSPSVTASSQAMYSTMIANEATKKKRQADQRSLSGMSSGVMGHQSGSGLTQASYHSGARETQYQSRRPPSPPPHSYPQHSSSRGYHPPPSHQPQHQSSHTHYQQLHDLAPPPPHHRTVSSGGSANGPGGQYPPSHSSPSRPLPQGQPLPTNKAMSMSNLLHHPMSSAQQPHHPRQGPM
ncbi:hypothetical protein BGZ99_006565 [Dissophora globulifera]|uniref:Ubinuclein middle domain-containing protein n=1 Tax=Dissophora globulifera TaxID=979702 RepID=A0A9P6RD53_9FUNG|nr:hypothetical protein BGZ99_006565 [Dissophora globulifera]